MISVTNNTGKQINLEKSTSPKSANKTKYKAKQNYKLNYIINTIKELSYFHFKTISLSFAINVTSLILPLIALKIFDIFIQNKLFNTLSLLIVGLCFVIIAETFLRLARNQLISNFVIRNCYKWQMRAGRQLVNSSNSVNAQLSSAKTISSIEAIDELFQFSGGSTQLAILDFPFIFLFLGVIWFIGGLIVLVPIIFIAGLAIWTLRSHKTNKPISLEQMDWQQQRKSFYAECIKGFTAIKALAVEPQMQRRFERITRSAAPVNHAQVLHSNRMALAKQLFINLTLISVITVGGAMAIDGILSVGAVTACLLISNHLSQMVLRIIEAWDQLESARRALEKSQSIMTLPQRHLNISSIQQPAKVQLNSLFMGDIDHPDKHRGINLTIGAGEIAGIIIRDDLKRKTIARLLRGLISPDHGEVRIDGIATSDENCDAALQGMLYVDENPAIFDGTVVENMSMFGSVNFAAAIELAHRFGVEPAIQKLPEAYQTRIDDIRTSKRSSDIFLAIALVRAAIIRPRLLILDIRRSSPANIGTHAFDGLIKELRGLSTIVILGSELTDLIAGYRNYAMHGWSLEVVNPIPPEIDKADKHWEDIPNG